MASSVSTAGDLLGVRLGRLHTGACLRDPRGRDELHRARDLLDGLRRPDPPPQHSDLCRHRLLPQLFAGAGLLTVTFSWSTSSSSSASALASFGTTEEPSDAVKAFLKSVDDGLEPLDVVVVELAGVADRRRTRPRGCAAGARGTPTRSGGRRSTGTESSLPMVPSQSETTCSSTGCGWYCGLLEQLDQAAAAIQRRGRGRVEVGTEGGERLQLAVLREVQAQRAGDLLIALTCAAPPTRETEIPTLIAGRTPWLNRSDSRKHLAVGDRDDVGGDVGRHVVGLGLDDRQTGHRSRAQLIGELRAALQQPGVQVEDVTGVGLTARRAAQQQRDRAVGLGLLRQVVEDDQDVVAVVHPVLAQRRAGVGGEPLEAGRVGRGSRDDRRVLQRAGVLQRRPDTGDRGALLADRRRRCSGPAASGRRWPSSPSG